MTVWGAYQSDSSNGFRVGWDITQSPAVVTAGVSTVTLTARLYMNSKYFMFGSSGNYSTAGGNGGATSGTFAYDLSGGNDIELVETITRTVPTVYGANQTVSFYGSVNGIVAVSGTATATVPYTVAARPISAPSAPTALAAARVSDAQTSLTWANHPTAAGPYSKVEVQRSINGGTYAKIATVAGTATSYQATGQVANRRYQYRVRAVNATAYSGYSTSGTISTTPSAPTGVKAAKTAAGDIIVTWTDAAPYNTSTQIYDLSGGSETLIATVASGSATSYTHVDPSTTATHQYRLRSVSSGPTLTSAYSAYSNIVQLLAAPNAPSGLNPNASTRDATAAIVLSWTHNAVDTTPQTAYEVQRRVNGGAWVSTGKVTSTTRSHTIAAGTLANGGTLEWQVRTYGSFATASPWSAVASVTLSSAPVATVNSPDGITPWPGSALTVTWGYYQAEDSPQAQWKATLYDAGGANLQALSGSGTTTSATFTHAVLDSVNYLVGVSVRSALGLWSIEDLQPFTVDYLEPPVPSIVGTWLPADGAVAVQVDVPAPGDGTVAATHLQVWRAVDGDDWRLIADGIEPGSAVTDFIPALGVINYYRAIAQSDLPSQSESDVIEVLCVAGDVFVNGGPGFSLAVRLGVNPAAGVTPALAKGLHNFAGRDYGVEWSGTQRSRDLSLTFDIYRGEQFEALGMSTWDEVEYLAMLPGPHCYRDPDGRRYFVTFSVSVSGLGQPKMTVTATMQQSDWTEPKEAEA